MAGLTTIPNNSTTPATPAPGYITTFSNSSGGLSWIQSSGSVQTAASLSLANSWTATQTFNVPVKLQTYTVATLPSAVTLGAGAKSFVTDATLTTFASAVIGSGANNVPVYSDGTVWRIG